MKKRFTEEQIGFALRQAESGTAVAEIIRKLEEARLRRQQARQATRKVA
jgi:hypothetical protein